MTMKLAARVMPPLRPSRWPSERQLDGTGKTAAFARRMKPRSPLLLSSIAIVALGSAMAMAQSVPQEPTPAPVVSAPVEDVQAQATDAVVGADQNDTPPIDTVGAPIDNSGAQSPSWAPDINLDALDQPSETKVARYGRVVKPRKVLSDAGDNKDTNGWTNANADAELLARGERRARPVDPAKQADLTKLSRVMGALHALRVACSGRDDQTYRSRMATLLDLEAPPSGALRDPLVDAFNGGFQTYGRGAGACPSDARAQEATLAKTGLVVARKLGSQYRPAPKVEAPLPPANQPRQNVAIVPPPAKSASWTSAN
jgi:uncharacterized protein (TIGR02301 family)